MQILNVTGQESGECSTLTASPYMTVTGRARGWAYCNVSASACSQSPLRVPGITRATLGIEITTSACIQAKLVLGATRTMVSIHVVLTYTTQRLGANFVMNAHVPAMVRAKRFHRNARTMYSETEVPMFSNCARTRKVGCDVSPLGFDHQMRVVTRSVPSCLVARGLLTDFLIMW